MYAIFFVADNGVIESDRVARIMSKVNRADFLLPKQNPCQDSPQYIGFGATISAPHMVTL